ncbi:MAG: protein kinase domain-containing protein [Ktedonobacterales bacterium]
MGWSDLIGRQLGGYTIVGELGRGGSSRVYRGEEYGENLELVREVAIKVIFNDAEDRIGFVRRFEREVQAVAQLDHPNIVAVYAHGETDDLVYLVMQCVTGGTLRQRCGRPVPVAEATAAIVQMCHALHHAHEHGIIHRDVKPSNMLVDAADPRHLLLTDFGIAKLQGMLGLTKSGTTIGTPEYMSPEQAEGKDIDQRTDVYALGCVLFELLAGRPPFVGSTAVSVLYQQVHLRPPHLRAFNAEVPRELGRIVEQALAKHPEERFGTAALLAEALYPFAEGSLPPGLVEPRTVAGSGTTASGPLPRDVGARASRPLPPLLPPLPVEDLSPIVPVVDDARSVLPPMESYAPSPSGSGELVAPDPESWQGLGTEGLDAIFPGDPEAWSSHDARVEAIVNTPTLEEMPQVSAPPAPPAYRPKPAASRELNRSIPLPDFRLPSKATRPLSMPLTASGRLDIEALMEQIEGQRSPSLDESRGEARPSMAGLAASAGQVPDPEAPAVRSSPRPWMPSPVVPPVDDLTESMPSRRSIADIDTDEMYAIGKEPDAARASRRSFSVPLGSIIAVSLCILLLVGVVTSVFVLGSHRTGHKTTVVPPTAAPTSTPLPSPTATPPQEPTATATVSPQQALNNEAAAAFNSVILSQFADNSCSAGNQTRQFGQGQTVYIDLCTSGGPFPGPVTVTIRQNGAILHLMVAGLNLSPNASYVYYEQYYLASGTYDMVVTMPVDGQTAVARDLVFTVS